MAVPSSVRDLVNLLRKGKAAKGIYDFEMDMAKDVLKNADSFHKEGVSNKLAMPPSKFKLITQKIQVLVDAWDIIQMEKKAFDEANGVFQGKYLSAQECQLIFGFLVCRTTALSGGTGQTIGKRGRSSDEDASEQSIPKKMKTMAEAVGKHGQSSDEDESEPISKKKKAKGEVAEGGTVIKVENV